MDARVELNHADETRVAESVDSLVGHVQTASAAFAASVTAVHATVTANMEDRLGNAQMHVSAQQTVFANHVAALATLQTT
jgi:hypothetical protein